MKQLYLYKSYEDFNSETSNYTFVNFDSDSLITSLSPEACTKTGYDLEGWYNKDNEKVAKVFVDAAEDITKLYAKWTPATNTKYKAIYLSYQKDNQVTDWSISASHEAYDQLGYILDEEDLVGITDQPVNVSQKEFEGFEIVCDKNGNPVAQYLSEVDGKDTVVSSNTIAPDGSTVVVYYYKRKTVYLYFAPTLSETDYSITYKDHNQNSCVVTSTNKSKVCIQGFYGEEITDIKITKADNSARVNPELENNNYTFKSYDETYDIIFTPVTIKYYFHFYKDHVQDYTDKIAYIKENGVAEEIDGYIGTAIEETNASITISFSNTDKVVLDFVNSHSSDLTDCSYSDVDYEDIIQEDGTKLRTYFVYYETNCSTITFNYNGGIIKESSEISFTGKIGSNLTEEQLDEIGIPSRNYYTYLGWENPEGKNVDKTDESIKFVSGNSTYKAIWTPNKYTLNFYEFDQQSYGLKSSLDLTIETTQVVIPSLATTKDFYSFQYWANEANIKSDHLSDSIILSDNALTSLAKAKDIWDNKQIKIIIDSLFTDNTSINVYPIFKALQFNVTIHSKKDVDYYDVSKGHKQQAINLNNRDDIINGKLASRLDVLEQYINNINGFLCQSNNEFYNANFVNAKKAGTIGDNDYVLPEVWSDDYTDPTKYQLYKKTVDGLTITWQKCTAEEQAALTLENWTYFQYYLNVDENATAEYNNILGFLFDNRNQLLKSRVIDCLPKGLTLSGSTITVPSVSTDSN